MKKRSKLATTAVERGLARLGAITCDPSCTQEASELSVWVGQGSCPSADAITKGKLVKPLPDQIT
jgi:hypothetical protein